mgnify:CR=1 FL=1
MESSANDFAENQGQHHFLAIEITNYLIKHNEELAIIPKFLYVLLSDIKLQIGTQAINVERIKNYVISKVRDKSIDYAEFDRKNSIVKILVIFVYERTYSHLILFHF